MILLMLFDETDDNKDEKMKLFPDVPAVATTADACWWWSSDNKDVMMKLFADASTDASATDTADEEAIYAIGNFNAGLS